MPYPPGLRVHNYQLLLISFQAEIKFHWKIEISFNELISPGISEARSQQMWKWTEDYRSICKKMKDPRSYLTQSTCTLHLVYLKKKTMRTEVSIPNLQLNN